jgi:hypothetical protein
VTFRNGMIRMELGSLPVAEDVDGKQAQMEAHSRVVGGFQFEAQRYQANLI